VELHFFIDPHLHPGSQNGAYQTDPDLDPNTACLPIFKRAKELSFCHKIRFSNNAFIVKTQFRRP